jgi:hypothetical protein
LSVIAPCKSGGVLAWLRAPFDASGTVRVQTVNEHLYRPPPGFDVDVDARERADQRAGSRRMVLRLR